ncbi:MAG: phosphate transport system regulatory protein PhoU, partial [Vallitaleaceae bacterium]|nr:phosphate transport system regulatory protein PhoU [Vallitaleaceae bacterium]
DEVDQYFYSIINELVELMIENPEEIRQCKELMFIVKYLEKMGDHATNIADWIVYTVTGSHAKYN